MGMQRTLVGFAAAAVVFAGCVVEEMDLSRGSYEGRNVNGRNVNGRNVNGRNVNGVSFAGISLAGGAIKNLSLDGTALVGQRADGSTAYGTDFIGALLTGTLSDGSTIDLYIANITAGAAADILAYDVIASVDGGLKWFPLCDVDDTGAATIKSTPLAGRWDYSAGTPTGGSHIDDPSQFTFACFDGVLAKCALMGYAPWRHVTECTSALDPYGEPVCFTYSLADHHQACTRMLRADYCGDGVSHTFDGTDIIVWDVVDIQEWDPTADWPLEAEWANVGARCVSRTRWNSIDDDPANSAKRETVGDYITAHCADRWEGWLTKLDYCTSATSDLWPDVYWLSAHRAPSGWRALTVNHSQDLSTPGGIGNL
jgi:hypothetical protein